MNLGWMEMVVVLIVALLLFGKRLPEVGRSLGKGILEFKKGIKGIEDDVNPDELTRVSVKQDDRSRQLPKTEEKELNKTPA
ncbi:MAG: twin-arginine translocase TatA/TatE family subunit [Planctomycetes bacterium]|nr:twin-arginine translocase TatA/TatE family subunit [Planctomycetota bacterium]MBI3848256.1 twin-arginine translocase TatA/TatE family subunit [Planctomycetota bacterium]